MFPSFASEGQRRAFWHSNQQKQDSKGSEEEGKAGWQGGHAFGGGGILKGKREGVRRSLGKPEGGERDVRHRV